MNLILNNDIISPDKKEIEIVERKGLGHPDTIADAIAEVTSNAFSNYCLENFGFVLHHNLDKAGIHGGLWVRDYGISEMKKKIRVVLGGRASMSFAGQEIPVYDIQRDAVLNHLHKVLPNLPSDSIDFYHLTSDYSLNPFWFNPRSIEDVPDARKPWANDTSVVTSYAPFTPTEDLVLSLENFFYIDEFTPRFKDVGQDIKVMAVRNSNNVDITVCVPLISIQVSSFSNFQERCLEINEALQVLADEKYGDIYNINVKVNTTMTTRGIAYLTGTGSCIEFGEEGLVGRGNSPKGIISSNRPFSMEACYGKNPVYHTGKVHSYFTNEISRALYENFGTPNNVMVQTNNGESLLDPTKLIISGDFRVSKEEVQDVASFILTSRSYTEDITSGYLVPKSW